MIALIVLGWAALIAAILAFLKGATAKDEEYEEAEQEPAWMALHTEAEQAIMRRWVGIHQPDSLCETVCLVHNPSQGAHRDLPPHWRGDKGIMERICSHGVGHPDPDQTLYLAYTRQGALLVHGCDGCCWSWRTYGFNLEEL